MATLPRDSSSQETSVAFSALLEKRSRGVAILKLEGNLKTRTSRVIEAAAEKSKIQGVSELIVVLELAGSFEASLLEDIVRAQELMRLRAGNLRIVARQPELFNMLRVMWVKGRSRVYPELTSALTSALISLEAKDDTLQLELVPFGSSLAIRGRRRPAALASVPNSS